MKLLHISDLHLGKRVNETSMLEDQKYILEEFLRLVEEERPDAVLVAGDVYDKAVPPSEAVTIFDRFLVELSERGVETFVISGNHDSSERIAFGSRLMDQSGVHLSPRYDGRVTPFRLEDEHGSVFFYMLPFLHPADVRECFPEAEISGYTEALRFAVEQMHVDEGARNVLLTHQFVTGGQRCDSENVSVGGTDNVDASVFDAFDYVALGHLHGEQSVGRETLRYSGSPLKYSLSEKDHVKCALCVELGEKGGVSVRRLPLRPLRDLRQLRGSYEELTLRQNYEGTARDDYLYFVLTDEEERPNAVALLRTIYPHLMELRYDNSRSRSSSVLREIDAMEQKSEIELFADFYEQQNNLPLSEEQYACAKSIFEDILEETV